MKRRKKRDFRILFQKLDDYNKEAEGNKDVQYPDPAEIEEIRMLAEIASQTAAPEGYYFTKA